MLEGREEMGKCGWVGGGQGVERMVMKREEPKLAGDDLLGAVKTIL